MAAHMIEVSRGTEALPDEPDEADIRSWLNLAMTELCEGPSTVSVRVVDSGEMCSLNSSFRGKPNPTNVLSFPDEVTDEAGNQLLGDIAVCNEVVMQESQRFDIPYRARYAHMLIHGLLHLVGHDHIDDEERGVMESLERELMANLGMNDPYEVVDDE